MSQACGAAGVLGERAEHVIQSVQGRRAVAPPILGFRRSGARSTLRLGAILPARVVCISEPIDQTCDGEAREHLMCCVQMPLFHRKAVRLLTFSEVAALLNQGIEFGSRG